MTIDRILVAGGTGLIGRPVARRLLADGYHVRLLVRDRARASAQLGTEFEYVEGSVTDAVAVDRAVESVDWRACQPRCRGRLVTISLPVMAAVEEWCRAQVERSDRGGDG